MSTTNAGMGYEYVKRLVQKMAAAKAFNPDEVEHDAYIEYTADELLRL